MEKIKDIFKQIGSKLGIGFLIGWVSLFLGTSGLSSQELELSFYQVDGSKEVAASNFVVDRSTKAIQTNGKNQLMVFTDCYVAYLPYDETACKEAALAGNVFSDTSEIFYDDDLLLDLDATACRHVATTICDCSCLCQCSDCMCSCPGPVCACQCHCDCNVCSCACSCACACSCSCSCSCSCTCNCFAK